MSEVPDPQALAVLRSRRDETDSGPRTTGFGPRQSLPIRPRSALWEEVEAAQDEVWGIDAETERKRQLWRDICTTLIAEVEVAVQPLADFRSRPGLDDRDQRARIFQHRAVRGVSDLEEKIPQATVDVLRVEFVDLLSVEFVPTTLGRFAVHALPTGKTAASYGNSSPLPQIAYIEWRDGKFHVVSATPPCLFTDEVFAELVASALRIIRTAS